jgi:DNA-binding FadR family transcriptional regulator
MIYEAVSEGDAEAAELCSRQHIRRVRRYMTQAGQPAPEAARQ